MTPLRDFMLDAYGGYADQRYKDRTLDRPIKVDDKGSRDVCPSFGSIFVSVPDRTGETLILTIHQCPTSPEVMGLVEALGGSVLPADFRPTISLTLRPSQGPKIKQLATAIKAIVGRGRTYDDPNLRWICPRTAASLKKLARHMADFRSPGNVGEEDGSPYHIIPRPRPGVTPGKKLHVTDRGGETERLAAFLFEGEGAGIPTRLRNGD